MKWTFVVQQKLKIALLLSVIMGAVILFNLILQKNISDIDRSVNSIYSDRLIPATDIFYLSESLHNRKSAIEQVVYRNQVGVGQLRAELKEYDVRILQLVNKYEKTYMVEEESVSLADFKRSISTYSSIEDNIVGLLEQGHRAAGLKLYDTKARAALQNTLGQLSGLTTIQSAVGSKLVKDTRAIVAISNILSDLQIAIAVIIGLLVLALVASSRIINQPQAKFNLN